jgi:hypothetical protein
MEGKVTQSGEVGARFERATTRDRPYWTTFFVGATPPVRCILGSRSGPCARPRQNPNWNPIQTLEPYSYLERRNKWFSARRKLINLERGAFSGVKATP